MICSLPLSDIKNCFIVMKKFKILLEYLIRDLNHDVFYMTLYKELLIIFCVFDEIVCHYISYFVF